MGDILLRGDSIDQIDEEDRSSAVYKSCIRPKIQVPVPRKTYWPQAPVLNKSKSPEKPTIIRQLADKSKCQPQFLENVVKSGSKNTVPKSKMKTYYFNTNSSNYSRLDNLQDSFNCLDDTQTLINKNSEKTPVTKGVLIEYNANRNITRNVGSAFFTEPHVHCHKPEKTYVQPSLSENLYKNDGVKNLLEFKSPKMSIHNAQSADLFSTLNSNHSQQINSAYHNFSITEEIVNNTPSPKQPVRKINKRSQRIMKSTLNDTKNTSLHDTKRKKSLDNTEKINNIQSDFSQFLVTSQVMQQIENAILRDEEVSMRNIISKPDEQNACTNTTNALHNFPTLKCNEGTSNSRKKKLTGNTVENVNVIGLNTNRTKSENLWAATVELEVSELCKSSKYRRKVTTLFENVEDSICHLGPNQDQTLAPDPLVVSEKRNILHSSVIKPELPGDIHNSTATNVVNDDWGDDSFITDAFVNALTQNEEDFGDMIKNALLKNAAKSIEPVSLVNQTLVSQKPVFQALGPFYGLPNKVRDLIKLYKGIDKLYDWQDECLTLPVIKNHKNLVYALPTSGGKTLVAEVLILQEILCRRRNAILILPYVAIVQEKVWALSPFAVALDFLIEEYAAGKGAYPPRKRRYKNSVYIATIEKALNLINSLVETGRLDELGLVIVDELHLIGENGRGPTLEALLTKLMFLKGDVQIIGMSATIGNILEICTFLQAEVYSCNFRPVELTEYVKCGNEIAKVNWGVHDPEKSLEVVRKVSFHYSDAFIAIDSDRLGGLVMEIVPKESCLIFCSTKKSCENVALLLSKVMFSSVKLHKKDEKESLKASLKDEGTLCDILNRTIPFGVAYHHSGLTSEERRIIEDGFRAGIICVICCTSTLAAGVNLPAKRVIIRQPYIGKDFLVLSRYKQMVGRAGRAGLGEMGESFLICKSEELPKVRQLLISPMDQAVSSMHDVDGKGLRHLFLSCISLGTAVTRNDLKQVANTTLLAVQQDRLKVDVKKLTDKVIRDLFKLGALEVFSNEKSSEGSSSMPGNISVRMDTSNTTLLSNSIVADSQTSPLANKTHLVIGSKMKLVVSKLGKAAIKGGLELSRAHMLYEDLLQAQQSLVLLDSLHLLYLVTPYDLSEQIRPSKTQYYGILMELGKRELQTAKILGITESCAVRMLSNQPIKNIAERVLTRFYMSLMLYDLWNEATVFQVSEKYQVNRGIVQNLMTSASTFAANVVSFCEELEEFWAFAHLLRGMSQRLSHCCVKELLPLMELPAVKQNRAKQLFNAGYKSLQSIAKADPNDLIQNIEFMTRRVANQLIAAAKLLLLEKVETLREAAEDVLDGIEQPKQNLH